jgi:cysteinyl-tRNA synthetase
MSECAHGAQYVRYWMHNGMLTMARGQKMGKSLGNVINVHLALQEFPAEALRMYYLQSHYRSGLPWNGACLQEALALLARLYDAKELAQSMSGEEDADFVAEQLGKEALQTLKLGRSLPKKFLSAMDSDFNTAQALGHLLELARAINRFGQIKKAKKRGGPVVAPALQAFALVGEALGLVTHTTTEFQQTVKDKRLHAMGLEVSDVEALIANRAEARANKEWAAADAIRDELLDKKIVIMDGADGVEWRVSFS